MALLGFVVQFTIKPVRSMKKYEDQILLEEINEGYARLKADKKAWEEELKERQELEGTGGDGLDDDE